MVYLNANISVITVNLNGLIAPNKIKASHAGLKIKTYKKIKNKNKNLTISILQECVKTIRIQKS